MQWSDSPHAGFTAGTPYLPVSGDYRQVNVASQERDPRSLLAFYRRLIAVRKAEPALREGLQTHVRRDASLLFFQREFQDRRLLVVLNTSGDGQRLNFSDFGSKARILLSTSPDRQDEACAHEAHVRGHEGLILVLE